MPDLPFKMRKLKRKHKLNQLDQKSTVFWCRRPAFFNMKRYHLQEMCSDTSCEYQKCTACIQTGYVCLQATPGCLFNDIWQLLQGRSQSFSQVYGSWRKPRTTQVHDLKKHLSRETSAILATKYLRKVLDGKNCPRNMLTTW